MPDLSLTDEQHERIEAVRAELEAAYVGEYGHLRMSDAVDYLLDTYTPPEEATGIDEGAGGASPSPSSGGVDAGTDDSADDDTDSPAEADDGGSGSPLQAVAKLLEDNDDVWRESDGETRYEVDLPDGSTEPCRTKDDVKRLLFKHYR